MNPVELSARLKSQYLDYLKLEREASPCTLENYGYDIRHFVNFVVPKNLLETTMSDVRRYVSFLKLTKGLANTSINRKLISLRSMFSFFVSIEVVSQNPFVAFNYIGIRRKKPLSLKSNQLIHIMNHLDSECRIADESGDELKRFVAFRNRLMIKIMILSGFRRSEVITLKRSSLVKSDSSWAFSIMSRTPDNTRIVPVHSGIYSNLIEYLKMHRGISDFLFVQSKTGRPLSVDTLYLIFKDIRAAIPGLSRIMPKSLRHTFASRLAANGESLRTIQDLMGHKKIETTQIYIHVPDKTRAQAVNRLTLALQ